MKIEHFNVVLGFLLNAGYVALKREMHKRQFISFSFGCTYVAVLFSL
jgi:hypothetical protein